MFKIPEDGKLIDAGLLYRYADGEYNRMKNKHGVNSEMASRAEVLRDIIGVMAYDLPAVDAKQVVHGNWVYKPFNGDNDVWLYHCSVCNAPNARERSYCSDCGTLMDGDTVEES
jgi:hypothetical protein